MAGVESGQYRFGRFELDVTRRRLSLDGEPLNVKPKAFDLLLELVRRRGSVVSKDELLAAVWPDQFVEENNLTVHVSALRKLLVVENDAEQMIATLPGRGYSFVAPVECIDENLVIEQRTVERIIVEHDASEGPPLELAGRRPPKLWTYVIVLLAIVSAGVLIYRYSVAPETPNVTSVAVLPFANETDDPNNDYLSDGIAEGVTFALSQMPGVRVMSRGSAYRYKGKNANADAIGRELNVQAILTGRVSRHGDSLNVSTELVSTSDNSVIWGEQFSRKMSDIEKIQSDITGSISNRLRLKLTGVKPRMTENAEAYQAFLQARYHWNKRTPENLKTSIGLFNRAIELDPQFSQAYGGLAMAYEVQRANGVFTDEEIRRIDRLASETAKKALELDSELAEAHAVLGMRRMLEWDFTGSEVSFKRAIEINPNFATAWQWYSELLATVGRHAEAKVAIDKAYELDPFSPAIIMNVGLRYLGSHQTDEAIAQFQKLNEMEPGYPPAYVFLAAAYIEKGMLLESLAPDCKGSELLNVIPPDQCERRNEVIRAAFVRDGPPGFWRESLKVSQRYHQSGVMDDVTAAGVYFRVGDRDHGFALLEKAFAEHSSYLTYIRVDPPFRDLKDDPRYQDLLRRIGLPPL